MHGCISSPVTLPRACGATPGEAPCIFQDNSLRGENRYLNMLNTTTEQSEMFSRVTKVEGGGWGAKVSTGVGVMTGSSISQTSLSMTIGGSKSIYSKKIRNIVNL